MADHPGSNVLISSAGAKVLLVQAFRKALGDRGRVFTADLTDACAGAHLSDGHFCVRPSSDPAAMTDLLTLCRDRGIGLVIPTRDGELMTFARHRAAFLEAGIRILVPAPETVLLCQNKRAFGDFLDAHGFPSIPVLSSDTPHALPFPVFVRPVIGSAGKGARRVDTVHAFLEAELSPDVLIHPLIKAPEYSIDLLMNLDGTRALQAVVRERVQVVAGEAKISRVVDHPAMTAVVTRLGKALGLVGHNTVQAFDCPQSGIRLIEVNPRFGGASNLSIEAGLQSPHRLLQMIAGDEQAYIPTRIDIGATMYRYSQDVIVPGGPT